MFKAVIFDMDGVIIDSEPLYKKANYNIFNKLGANINKDTYKTFVGKSAKIIWSYIKKNYNTNYTIEELIMEENEGFIAQLNKIENKELILIKDTVNLIKELYNNKIPLGLATSSIRTTMEKVVELFNLKKYFQVLTSGDDIKNGKPAPDIFLYTANELNIKPSQCIVIEDSENGVNGAKDAGMKCIGYISENSGNQNLSRADIIIDDISQLSYNFLKTL